MDTNGDICTFYELIERFEIKIPIIQRDYAQGRPQNGTICRNFLGAIRAAVEEDREIDLDFIYGNEKEGVFLPLDGQQRLTTLFLLHWFAAAREGRASAEVKRVLSRFTYETRRSSRRFCEALVANAAPFDPAYPSVKEQIVDASWFFVSWRNDATIDAMLHALELIEEIFAGTENLWDALTVKKIVRFHILRLEDFDLSDDLYIKMNARGKVLTAFEKFKAELQDKSVGGSWEEGLPETEKFTYKLDNEWTNFFWKDFRKGDTVDGAHMNFITALLMARIAESGARKGSERDELVRALNESAEGCDLVPLIDRETFERIGKAYELYRRLAAEGALPQINLPLWSHKPERSLLDQIVGVGGSSYSQKALFFAQTEYLLRVKEPSQEGFSDWMRVIRNIVCRANLTPDGKRSDILRSPESYAGAIGLFRELAEGCENIYGYLNGHEVISSFAREQTNEEIVKAKIVCAQPQYRSLIAKTEDNELLRGRILIALECAGYDGEISRIDFALLEKVSGALSARFDRELASDDAEFDRLRRVMLTVEANGKRRFYEYWWSFWHAGGCVKRKLFTNFREIEYFIGRNDFKLYFINLLKLLSEKSYEEILSNYPRPEGMPNWQYRLISEDLLSRCGSKYIAVSDDDSYCYLLKSKRPSEIEGNPVVF